MITGTPINALLQQPDQEPLLQLVFGQLRLHTGHDFSNYKRPTLLRRIQRRMQVHHLSSLADYISYLQQHPEEVWLLMKNLLISVTGFFRDEPSFQELADVVLPQLFRNKGPEQTVRIWVAGCATGEEAYSIAMLCAMHMDVLQNPPRLEIFATDIDEQALEFARAGCYALETVASLPVGLLQRFFIETSTGYCIRSDVKAQVTFHCQNMMNTIPATHIDLICCRNVLIYLNYTAQRQVLSNFQTALNQSGFLFLGKAESINGAPQAFSLRSREHQLYQYW